MTPKAKRRALIFGALAVSHGMLIAGWWYDLQIGKYYQARCKKMSEVGLLLVDQLERAGVVPDDFTNIAIQELAMQREDTRWPVSSD